VHIAVRAAGLTFAEVMARGRAVYPDAPKLPCVLDYEVADVGDALGAEMTGL